jgi:ATP-dependent Lon protease
VLDLGICKGALEDDPGFPNSGFSVCINADISARLVPNRATQEPRSWISRVCEEAEFDPETGERILYVGTKTRVKSIRQVPQDLLATLLKDWAGSSINEYPLSNIVSRMEQNFRGVQQEGKERRREDKTISTETISGMGNRRVAGSEELVNPKTQVLPLQEAETGRDFDGTIPSKATIRRRNRAARRAETRKKREDEYLSKIFGPGGKGWFKEG